MTPRSFHVTEEDATALHDAYGDGSYGDTLANHVCARSNDGINHSTA